MKILLKLLGWKTISRKGTKSYDIMKHSQPFMEELVELQREEINRLEKLIDVLKYYGNEGTYMTSMFRVITPHSPSDTLRAEDLEELRAKDGSYIKLIGGKKAREALREYYG